MSKPNHTSQPPSVDQFPFNVFGNYWYRVDAMRGERQRQAAKRGQIGYELYWSPPAQEACSLFVPMIIQVPQGAGQYEINFAINQEWRSWPMHVRRSIVRWLIVANIYVIYAATAMMASLHECYHIEVSIPELSILSIIKSKSKYGWCVLGLVQTTSGQQWQILDYCLYAPRNTDQYLEGSTVERLQIVVCKATLIEN